jgi:hypothetical protein
MSSQLGNGARPEKTLPERWSGLLWVLQFTSQIDEDWPSLAKIVQKPNAESARETWKSSDLLARQVSSGGWTEADSLKILKKLSKTAPEFENRTIAREVQARRAERLVLALDRLTCGSSKKTPADAALEALFAAAQNLAEFDALKFAAALKKFEAEAGLNSTQP